MDYKDYAAGIGEDFFYFRAKRGLIAALLEKIPYSSKTLVVGPGTGSDISVIKKYCGEVYAVDIESEALKLIPDDLIKEKLLSDVRNLPYGNGYFDSVLAFDVLEHIEDDSSAIKEIYRVLRPGGAFIFTVPAFGFLFSAHDRALGHFRRYNKNALRDLLKEFSETRFGYWVFTLFSPVAFQRLLNRKGPPKVLYMKLPKSINRFLKFILSIETLLIRHDIPLPFGTTIFGISTKI